MRNLMPRLDTFLGFALWLRSQFRHPAVRPFRSARRYRISYGLFVELDNSDQVICSIFYCTILSDREPVEHPPTLLD
jgi:hypothetical protein